MNLRSILAELRAERDRIDHAITAIESLNSAGRRVGRRGRPVANQIAGKPRRRRHMSAAARRKLSAMMKARWAARKKAKGA